MAKGLDGFLEERVETLYVSEEYKAFLLTGQPNGKGRNAYIYVKPFNAYTNEAMLDATKSAAKPLDADSRITISSDTQSILVRDGYTGTQSEFPIHRLDKEVRERLAAGTEKIWDKYAKSAATPLARKFTI